MKKEFKFITLSRVFVSFAFDLGNIFGIIYFYSKFNNSIITAIGAYILLHSLYALSLFISPALIQKLKVKKSLIISAVFYALAFLPLLQLEKSPQFRYVLAWMLISVIAKSFYHVSFDYYIAKNTSSKKRGSEVGFLIISIIIVQIFAPLLGGAISSKWGLIGLITTIAISFFLSLLPLFFIDDLQFSYTHNFKYLLKLKSIQNLIKYNVANELQSSSRWYWYIYLFIFFDNSFDQFGIVFSLARFVSIFLLFVFSRYLDSHNRKKTLNLEGLFMSIGWILRAIANTPIFIIISDIFYKLSRQLKDEAITVLNLDQSTHGYHDELVDEHIIIKQIIMNITAAITLAITLIVYNFFGFTGVFVFSGLTSLLLLLV